MAGELQAQFATGATLYAVLLSAAGAVWNGSTFDATPTTGEWTTYAVAMAEDGATGCYRGDLPGGAGSGRFSYRIYKQAGGSAAATDPVVWTGEHDTRLANLDAAVSTRSTYAGADTAGTTTLLARVTALVQTKAEADADTSALAAAIAALPSVSTIWAGITAGAANLIADHVLRRTMANAKASANGDTPSVLSLYGQVLALLNASRTASALTVKHPDGTTLGTPTVTENNNLRPVSGVDA